MNPVQKMIAVTIGVGSLTCVLLFVFIWPTPYEYVPVLRQKGEIIYKINRFSGKVEQVRSYGTLDIKYGD